VEFYYNEDGGDMFSETSVRTSATQNKVSKAFIIDTAVKTSQKVFFDCKYHPSVERLINNVSTVRKLCNHITPRNTEYGSDVLRNVDSN
jgi:hypothetical protein